jgi:hypothetical protein
VNSCVHTREQTILRVRTTLTRRRYRAQFVDYKTLFICCFFSLVACALLYCVKEVAFPLLNKQWRKKEGTADTLQTFHVIRVYKKEKSDTNFVLVVRGYTEQMFWPTPLVQDHMVEKLCCDMCVIHVFAKASLYPY